MDGCADSLPEDPSHPDLEVLVRNLDQDTTRCKRLINQLLEDDQAAFVRHAIEALKKSADGRGAQFVLGLLAERGLLAGLMCDPGIDRENALKLARAALRVCPKADILLARSLTEMVEHSDGSAQFAQATRLMEILAGISQNVRVFPSLVRLLRHSNPHIRSKAVLMIGRGHRSTQWTRHRLQDADPRIRANALEALWDVHTDEARQLLESLVRDPNNRVAGNAILGLYRLGLASAVPEVLSLASHESALFRATAAWVMGESGDPRFTEVLAGMLREPNATVRKRAFAALGRIRTAVAQAMQAAPCRLAGRFLDPDPKKNTRRLVLAVTGQTAVPAPVLLPTNLLLHEDGRMVVHYRLVERPLAETISVVFILPGRVRGAARDSALGCLPWKRPSDLWTCLLYEADAAEQAGAQPGTARFHAAPEAIHSEFARVPDEAECPDLWRAIRRSVDTEEGPLPGKQHLIVFAPPETRGAPSEELIAAVAAVQAFVQVICCGPDPILEDFCRKVNGVFWRIDQPAQLAAAALHAYLQQLACYEISYPPVNPEAGNLKIRLHGPSLCGETMLPIPAALRPG